MHHYIFQTNTLRSLLLQSFWSRANQRALIKMNTAESLLSSWEINRARESNSLCRTTHRRSARPIESTLAAALEATFTWVPVGTPLISLCLTLLVHIWKVHTPKEEKKTKGGEGRNRRDCSWCMAWRRDCWGPGWAWHIMPGSELKRGQFGLLDMGVIIITNPWVCRSKGLGMFLMSFGVTLLDAQFWMGWNRVTGGQI